MYKDNVNFSMDEEKISHSVYREFYFEPSKNSKLSDDETVIVPNIPLFGLIKKLSKGILFEVYCCQKVTLQLFLQEFLYINKAI